MNHRIHHYTKEEYTKLSKEQKRKLKEDRAKAKAAKLKANNAPADVRHVSAVTTTPHGTSIRSGESGDTAMASKSVQPPFAHVYFDSDITMGHDLTIEVTPLPADKMVPTDAHHSRMLRPNTGDETIDLAINEKAEHLYHPVVKV